MHLKDGRKISVPLDSWLAKNPEAAEQGISLNRFISARLAGS